MIESPARAPSITPRISYLALAGSQGLSPSCLRFSSCHVSFHSLPDDFCHPPHQSVVALQCYLRQDSDENTQNSSRARGCCVGYQQHLSPVFLECTLPQPLKEDVTLQWWNISPDAAVIRTDEHSWGPAWLSFKSAGAELIPFKQSCICAAAQWWIWLFSLSLTTKEERER